jgi:hypothetical protein
MQNQIKEHENIKSLDYKISRNIEKTTPKRNL